MFDDAGNDVTPRPMLSLRPTAVGGKPGSTGMPGASASGVEMFSMGSASNVPSAAQIPPPSSDMGFGSRTMGMSSDGAITDDEPPSSSAVGAEPAAAQQAAAGAQGAAPAGRDAPAEVPPADAEQELSEAQLDAQVHVTLQETELSMVLDIPPRCVGADDPEAAAVEEANVRYKEQLAGRDASEAYVEGTSQTLNAMMKNKEVQESAPKTAEAGIMANSWDIYDRMNAKERRGAGRGSGEAAAAGGVAAAAGGAAVHAAGGGGGSGSGGGGDSMVDGASMSMTADKLAESSAVGASGGGGGAAAVAAAAGGEAVMDAAAKLASLRNLPSRLALMERCVTQNAFHDQLLLYRDFATRRPEPALEAGSQALLPLWTFTCEATRGRNVACLAWNRARPDLLAVGYGSFDFSAQAQGGLVAFWSLKNPAYPDFIIEVPVGATALDFSEASPNLLAVGLYNGSVQIYDVRGSFATAGAAVSSSYAPVLESTHANGKHTDPVWKLRWVGSGTERGESLMSISTDGRVTQWSISKGLEHTDLMRLKRVASRAKGGGDKGGAGGKQEAFISRRSSGMTFDFSSRDASVYLAGTEDGSIHRCSTSYSEQYLESYFGHTGPVYQLRWSPFLPTHFLSCSADWTVRLWAEDVDEPLVTFQSTNAGVADCQWSPHSSTIFGSVTEDGKLQIWDLTVSTLKPVLSHDVVSDGALTSVLFAEESPVVVCGDSNGGVNVFRLVGVRGSDAPGQPALVSVLSRPGGT